MDDAETNVLSVLVVPRAVKLYTWQFQPLVAVAKPTTPALAATPVPTLIRKDAVPLFEATDGDVPKKPDEIVGAAFEYRRVVAVNVVNLIVLGVVPPIAPGEANVAPLSDDAFKLATLVVLVMLSGGVPVATVD